MKTIYKPTKVIKDPTFNVYKDGGNVETKGKEIKKDDLKKLAKDVKDIEFDLMQDLADTILEDFERERKEGQSFMQWLQSKPDDYFKRIELKKGGEVLQISDYMKQKEAPKIKKLNLADYFEYGKTIGSLTDAEKDVVNKLLRLSLGKDK